VLEAFRHSSLGLILGALAGAGCASGSLDDDDHELDAATGEAVEEILAEDVNVVEGDAPEASSEAVEKLKEETEIADDEVDDADRDLEEGGSSDELRAVITRSLERRRIRTRIPLESNSLVRKWITYFTGKDRERFGRFLSRGARYRALIQEKLAAHGIPRDLFYLAMIESGFSTHARSHASAVGMWQFIRSTGKLYGLRADGYVDERRDPIRATEAAARHLRDLYGSLGNWHLVLAAYNAGPRRIYRAIRRGGTRDFWDLVRARVLPRETRNYVPKFLAAVIIGRNPGRFGFEVEPLEPYPDVQPVVVPTPARLADLARRAGIAPSRLAEVNAHLLRGVTPPGPRSYSVWVPAGDAARARAASPGLARVRFQTGRSVASEGYGNVRARYHRVRRGDTLDSIARRYGTTVVKLKRLNGLRTSTIHAGRRLIVAVRTKGYGAGG